MPTTSKRKPRRKPAQPIRPVVDHKAILASRLDLIAGCELQQGHIQRAEYLAHRAAELRGMVMTRVLSGAEIRRLVEVTAQLGPWATPVVEALQSGIIAVQFLARSDKAPLDVMRRIGGPLLVWIGDDDELSCGPDGWRCALQVTRWARGAVVHAAGGEADHYRTVVNGTLHERRFLLVETSSRHALPWLTLLVGKPVLTVLPRSGPHPIASKETRH